MSIVPAIPLARSGATEALQGATSFDFDAWRLDWPTSGFWDEDYGEDLTEDDIRKLIPVVGALALPWVLAISAAFLGA